MNDHAYEKSPVMEYGIGFRGEVHRENMTFIEAKDWVDEWKNEIMNPGGNPDAFYMIRRPIGEWKRFVL